MSVMIGHASGDENGNVHGGVAGDQTGREVYTRAWYSRPWDTVVRCTDSAVAEKIATAMEYACSNNHIGYDQYQRTTLYAAVNALGWYPANIGKVTSDVETDCSALVAVCVNAAMGYQAVSKDIYTGNEADALKATGKFKVLTDSKYLTTADYLCRGDILINTVHHTAICLTDGSKAEKIAQPEKVYPGWKHNNLGSWYVRDDGTSPENEWECIDDTWYHFNSEGYMESNKFILENGKLYYIGKDGKMATAGTLTVLSDGSIVPVLDNTQTGDKPSKWAAEATEWAKAEGLIVGDGKGNYDWQKPVTREQLAQVLYNVERNRI